jgi:hypothetical protein
LRWEIVKKPIFSKTQFIAVSLIVLKEQTPQNVDMKKAELHDSAFAL